MIPKATDILIWGHFLQWLTSHIPTPSYCIRLFPALLGPSNRVGMSDYKSTLHVRVIVALLVFSRVGSFCCR